MLNIPFFSTSIIATSALLFSMNVTAFTSEKLLLTPALPVTLASTASAIPHCIADSAISADALSGTRDKGPFSIATKSLGRQSAKGFGGGTIHYPTNASGCGLLGAIAVVPGYVSYENSIKWWGPRLASWGFVVITINTNSIYDDPDSRATQLNAALDQMIADDTVGSMIDPERLGAIGWSMGGGGALKLATSRSAVRAIIPQAPYYEGSYGTMNTPAFMIGCEWDTIAPTRQHVDVFYNNASGPKMKIEVNDGNHSCANSGYNEALLGKPGIAWMQRYIHGDTRFNQFLCAKENYGSIYRVSDYDYANCS